MRMSSSGRTTATGLHGRLNTNLSGCGRKWPAAFCLLAVVARIARTFRKNLAITMGQGAGKDKITANI